MSIKFGPQSIAHLNQLLFFLRKLRDLLRSLTQFRMQLVNDLDLGAWNRNRKFVIVATLDIQGRCWITGSACF